MFFGLDWYWWIVFLILLAVSVPFKIRFMRWWYDRQQRMAETLRSRRIDFASVATDEDYVRALMGLFKNRGPR